MQPTPTSKKKSYWRIQFSLIQKIDAKFPEKKLKREIINETIAAATAIRNPTELADRVAITPTIQLRGDAETQK